MSTARVGTRRREMVTGTAMSGRGTGSVSGVLRLTQDFPSHVSDGRPAVA
jgi:hypothetical protein